MRLFHISASQCLLDWRDNARTANGKGNDSQSVKAFEVLIKFCYDINNLRW